MTTPSPRLLSGTLAALPGVFAGDETVDPGGDSSRQDGR